MTDELKPCPFCGGSAFTNQEGSVDENNRQIILYGVNCADGDKCGADMRFFDTKEKAITAWNKRVV